MKCRPAHVCGGIPESKGPANRLICKNCSRVALRNIYAGSLPEARALLWAICKGYVQSSPRRGAACSDPKEKLYERLFTHRKCMFIHSKSTALHMRSYTLVNNDIS